MNEGIVSPMDEMQVHGALIQPRALAIAAAIERGPDAGGEIADPLRHGLHDVRRGGGKVQ